MANVTLTPYFPASSSTVAIVLVQLGVPQPYTAVSIGGGGGGGESDTSGGGGTAASAPVDIEPYYLDIADARLRQVVDLGPQDTLVFGGLRNPSTRVRVVLTGWILKLGRDVSARRTNLSGQRSEAQNRRESQ